VTHRASRPTRPLSAATPSWCSPGLSEEQLVVVGRDWVVIDTETTGLDPARHELTQMAAVVLDDQCQEVADLAWETDDGHDLLRRVIADLNPYVGAGIVVAHNLLFDLGFLAPLASPARGLLAHPPRWLCTMRLTGGTMTLAALARNQGVMLHDPHTAAGDSRTLAEVLARLIDAARNRGYSAIAGIARVSPASDRARASSAEPAGNGWAEVVLELDHVVPIRPISREQRDAVADVRVSLITPDKGPANPVELANAVQTLRASGVARTALQVLLAECDHISKLEEPSKARTTAAD
jgi:hypothetical protein